jgi:hypothetical protein
LGNELLNELQPVAGPAGDFRCKEQVGFTVPYVEKVRTTIGLPRLAMALGLFLEWLLVSSLVRMASNSGQGQVSVASIWASFAAAVSLVIQLACSKVAV